MTVLQSSTTSYDFQRRQNGRPTWLDTSVENDADEPVYFTAGT